MWRGSAVLLVFASSVFAVLLPDAEDNVLVATEVDNVQTMSRCLLTRHSHLLKVPKGRAEEPKISSDASLSAVQTGTNNCLTRTNSSEPPWNLNLPGVKVFTELAQPAEPTSKPKLALLMLVADKVDHSAVWEAWMEQARRQDLEVKMFVHPYLGHVTEKPANALVAPLTVPTAWCDVFGAILYMVEFGLQDHSITHYAVVSADSVPLAPLTKIYGELEKDASSRLCFDVDWSPPRAETWWVLRRSDAQLFHENKELVSNTFKNGCIDENAWLNPLLLRHQAGTGHAPRNQCTMFTDWSNSCKNWARNIQGIELGKLSQQLHTDATDVHPRTYMKVDAGAWAQLRRTPFWFARKLAPGALAEVGPPYSFD